MSLIGNVINWFAGGLSDHAGHAGHGPWNYMRLSDCMNGDWKWIVTTVTLDFTVAAGYVLIAMHWWKNQKRIAASPARSALGNMRNIFVFCGICGYLFIPIKMFYPAWRLYDLIMLVLVYFTWRYALKSKQLAVIYNELDRSQKLARDLAESQAESKQKTFFLNAISHDLRTPLNGLMLQASVAEVSLDQQDADGLRASIQEIKASAKVTAELLGTLLEYGRMDWTRDDNDISECNLSELLQRVLDSAQYFADQKSLALTATCEKEIAILTDRMKLERILINLTQNAVKFTEKGAVSLSAEVAGTGLKIHVTDTGIGIDPQHMEHLFDEFFQGHNAERDSRKGFGLGLAITRRLAEQLGGKVLVESRLGHGTRFTIALPLAIRQADAKPAEGGRTLQVVPA